jgi:hypothetical protein
MYNRRDEIHFQRAYYIEEIKEALEKSGLTCLECLDAATFSVPTAKSERIFFIVRRKMT